MNYIDIRQQWKYVMALPADENETHYLMGVKNNVIKIYCFTV